MKNLLIILFVLCFALVGFSQSERPEIGPNIDEVEITAPHFTGVKNVVAERNTSSNFLKSYLSTNIIYPESAMKCYTQGTAIVEFVVTPEGGINDFKIINGVCSAIDDEIVRVLETTDGMWKPGQRDGKVVPMKREVSLVFALSDNIQNAAKYFQLRATRYYEKGSVQMLEKRKFKKAEKFYSMGMTYLPYDQSLLLLRGISRYEQGNKEGAREDWERLKTLGGLELKPEHLAYQLKHMKGYEELISMVNEK